MRSLALGLVAAASLLHASVPVGTARDTVPDAARTAALDSMEWDDSLAVRSSSRGSLSWGSTVRNGTGRNTAAFDRRSDEGVSLSFRHSDPGGLKRRNLSYRSGAFDLAAGDLPTWSDLSLLEGAATRRGGMRDSALAGRLLLGTGTLPNGVEAGVATADATARLRTTFAMGNDSSLRRAAAVSAGWRGFRAGLRISMPDSVSGVATLATALGWDRSGSHLEIGLSRDRQGEVWSAFVGRVRAELEDVRIVLAGRHVPAGFRHDGLPPDWIGTSAATASISRKFAPGSKLGFQIDGIRDSLGMVGARTTTELETKQEGTTFGAKAGWSENSPRSARWSLRSQASFEIGRIAPRLGFSVADSAGRTAPRGEIGASYRNGAQILSGSMAYSAISGSDWRVSHVSETSAGPFLLGLDLSAAGGMRSDAPLVGAGSLSLGW